MSKPIHQILLRPLLTEKSVRGTHLKRYSREDAKEQAGGNLATRKALREEIVVKYTFAVAMDANKYEIKEAVETLFAKEKVKVATVNTMHVRGKDRKVSIKRGKRPSTGTSPAWKKAVVTLTTDSPNIPLLEGA